MGYNELLLFLTALLSAAFICAAWWLNRERLHSTIILFLVLISLTGAKTVEFFGFVTNTGNIFYGSVFLATFFLIERYGKREGVRSIWIGVVCVVFFPALLRLSLALVDAGPTATISQALSLGLDPALRLAFASLCAYLISQNINVYLYTYLKESLHGKYLWIRANLSNLIAQGADSIVFFTIAFWGVVVPENFWGILMTGYIIKILYVAVFSPLLYLNTSEEISEKDHVSIAKW